MNRLNPSLAVALLVLTSCSSEEMDKTKYSNWRHAQEACEMWAKQQAVRACRQEQADKLWLGTDNQEGLSKTFSY